MKGKKYILICIATCALVYVILKLGDITEKDKKQASSSTQITVSPPTSKPKLDFALFLRMHAPKKTFYEILLVQSMKYFWTVDAPLVVVLDKTEEDKVFGKEIQQKFPFPKIYHEEFDTKYYHGAGHTLQQLSMFHAEKYINEKYVGFVDTDTMFATMVTPDQLFIDGKPVIIGQYGSASNMYWYKIPKMTELALGKKEVFRCMSYFPVMVEVKHLVEMRDYMARLHNMEFNQVFQKFSAKPFSQFNIMCNYLWYFHREKYTFHAQLRNRNGKWHGGFSSPARQGPNYYKKNVPESVRYPVARAAVHYKYLTGWKDPNTYKTIIKKGLCHSGGFELCPKICKPFDRNEVVKDLFVFEFNNWTWDKRCIIAQRKHIENIRKLNGTDVRNRILLGCSEVDNLPFKVE